MCEDTKIIVDGEETTINIPKLTILVHQQNMRVDVPESVEINSRKTIDCMEKMNQQQWEHISTGEIFQYFFHILFPKGEEYSVEVPVRLCDLLKMDFGVIHCAGMIILACNAIFEGNKKIFFRTPEDHLHPSVQINVVNMLQELQKLGNLTC